MIRKLLMTDSDLKKIEEDKDKWLTKNLETGGYIFGRLYPNGLAHVTYITDGGPKAERTPVSFSGDNGYANKVKEELQKEDSEIRLLGEYHVHPWAGLSNLSGGDVTQLHEAKKARPWFVVLLSTEDNFRVFDLEVEMTNDMRAWDEWIRKDGVPYQACKYAPPKNCAKEAPYQIVKTEVASRDKLLDRILKITRNDLLLEKSALLVGLGSGGSTVAKYLGCTGIGRIILLDKEELEVANIIRHEGCIEDLGKQKVEICKSIIESHNPFTVVEAHGLDVTKDTEKVEKLISEVNLIIGSSGSPKVNNILNKFSIEKGVPAVYGGVFERAAGGYILAVNPGKTACFNCLFSLTSESYFVDRDAARRYNLSEDELHKQQGLWMDISIPALLLSKVALRLLQGEDTQYNLLLYDSKLELKKIELARRGDCSVCNFEGWLRKQELIETPPTKTAISKTSPRQSIFSKIYQHLREKGWNNK